MRVHLNTWLMMILDEITSEHLANDDPGWKASQHLANDDPGWKASQHLANANPGWKASQHQVISILEFSLIKECSLIN